jgi:hypothetical protein
LNPKQEIFTSPQALKTNTANVSTFSEKDMFKEENIKLKIDESKDSKSLFLMLVLANESSSFSTEEKNIQFLGFLENPFLYPQYFFENVLKYKLEYLASLDPNSMSETWEEINLGNISAVAGNQSIFCRVNLKDKKYFDKIAHEYFLLEA